MHIVTSFHASAAQPQQLGAVMADYVALERAQTVRRVLVKRFGILTLAVGGTAFVWLSTPALWLCVGMCLVVPAAACIVELARERRLTRRLRAIPGNASQVVRSADRSSLRMSLCKKVIKSS
jgi:Flp pilus assembly protein TadB